MNREEYEILEMETITFDSEDCIATSGEDEFDG